MNQRTTTLALITFFVVCSCAFAQDELDLSIPMFEPKPVVWIDDWKPAQQESNPERDKASKIVSVADRLKAAGQYGKAATTYNVAIAADPTWSYPPYQLACNYELWGKHDKAVPEFEKAIQLGFADFPTALADDELGKLREAGDFNATLTSIRERYIEDSEKRIGTPIAVKPEGEQPEEGWPVILMLHGYGDSNLNYIKFAQAWAKLGFVAVAVPGSVPNRVGGFVWGLESTDPTLKDLRAIMKSDLISNATNPEAVYMLGFSQGALHAILIAAEHRDEFKGVIALSPGGSLSQQILDPKISDGRSGRLVFIHGSREPHAEIAQRWDEACVEKGWKYMSSVHPGGHHFPADWNEQQPKIAKFLLE